MDYIRIEHLGKDFYPAFSFSKLLKLNFKRETPTKALKNITFSLEKGRILGILGTNGAGKTTLLKIISTLILPDQGAVHIKNYRLGENDNEIKSLVGLVCSQERNFYWRLNGRQNLEFFAHLYGLDIKTANSRMNELFSIFQIDSQTQKKRFDTYSTGLKQKFALIRTLLNNPELLLLDEPTKSLDYKVALEFRSFIKEILVGKQGKAVMLATHNMQEAKDLCQEFIILHKGKIQAKGTLEELRRNTNNPEASLEEIFLILTK